MVESREIPSGDLSLPPVSTRGILYKWKNHFYEMKGDVGMSRHEKEREQEDAYTKTKVILPLLHYNACSCPTNIHI